MNAARRLIELAQEAEERDLRAARGTVLQQYQRVNLKAAEKALTAALSQPRAKRAQAVKGVLQLISEASRATGTPPADLLRVVRRSVRDRALNARDLAVLSDPSLVFPDPGEAAADAVARQRADMNRYWAKEQSRFRDDAARTVREALRKGQTPEQAADLLQERLNVSRSRAVLIAQDQMLTASATAERRLLRAAGAKEFQWHCLMDGKQRKAHGLLHGRIFTWRSAPELPGQAIRCRCRALVPKSQGKLRDMAPAAPGPEGQPAPPQRTDGLLPQGRPIGQHTKTPAGEAGREIREALAAIDAVHGDGPLPTLRIYRVTGLLGSAEYDQNRPAILGARVNLNARAEQPQLTIVHEVGHMLHHRAFNWAKLPALADAMDASAHVQQLWDMMRNPDRHPLRTASGMTYRPPPDLVPYLLRDEELFARAYAQYVAVKSGNPVLLAQLNARRAPLAQVPS